jgi:HAD superfamily hydrolase (TIGR01509 family)
MQAVIFDLDGLMINSEDLSLKAWRRVLAPYGRGIADSDYHAMIGLDSPATSRRVIELTSVPLAGEELSNAHWRQLLDIIERELEPMPGLLALIQEITDRNCPLAIASNSPSDYVERALKAIGVRNTFRCVVGRDKVARGKPAPDVYLAAAACLGAAPERCLALEDSPIGMQAALAAGMQCVVVPNEHLNGADFGGAHGCYKSLVELRGALGSWLV